MKNSEKGLILTPERRVLAFQDAELRVKRDESTNKIITGYAAKFGKLSQLIGDGKRRFVEKIDRLAFERCLERCDVRGLKNHDPGQLLGRTGSGTMRLSTDDTGLKYEIDAPDTQVGRDTVAEIERGDLDGSSFSFTVEDEDGDDWDDTQNPPVRTLKNVRDLFDLGPVTFPAYLDTEASARSYDRFMEVREQAQREQAQAVKVQRIRLLKVRLGQFSS